MDANIILVGFVVAVIGVTLPQLTYSSKELGHPAIFRENMDMVRKAIILTDPSTTVETPSILAGWNLYTLEERRRESIHLQIWRPNNKVIGRRRIYRMVWDVQFYAHMPGETKLVLEPEDRFDLEEGDTMGIHFPGLNPVPWAITRCHGGNVHLFRYNLIKVAINAEYPFETAETSWNPCRLYSLNATTITEEEAKDLDDIAQRGTARIYTQKPYGYNSAVLDTSDGTHTSPQTAIVFMSSALACVSMSVHLHH